MAKDKEKKNDDKLILTEWQKRNIEFLKKKKQQAEEEKKLKEKLLTEKKAQLQSTSEEDKPVEPEDETKSPSADEPPVPKKKKKIKKVKEKSLSQIAFQKSLPVILVSLLLMAASIFMITPYSKVKDFSIKGNHQTNLEELVKASKVKASDYWLTLVTSPGPYEQAIVDANPWVKSVKMSYQFPNHFQFNVTEFEVIAYAQVEGGFQPILENGKRVDKVKASELPKSFLIINLEDEKAIQELVKQLTTLPKSLVKNIKSVSLAGSKTTSDLLVIDMHDGNLIRVPQSQLTLKLPYYQKLKKNLESDSIVDMEVGIYTTTADIENQVEVPVATEQNTSNKEGESADSNPSQDQSGNQHATDAGQGQASEATEVTNPDQASPSNT
ncbi:cell division protein FtsQ/DivIB [Streptococcus dysgalactiae]|uniref:Cell division protein DivIB n=1 Tax=Streptococcus dysgalactiae TaxID=1334 RepID=A0AAE9UMW4_STRDY|nr:cell division protein FtsQ/DivIB [Streptococcus dysgalactiae]QGH04510.1 cell division protein FtsQ/DivIB [Streptococcus dysgalactiae subsp. dysgalactiae]WAI93618.1 cell division protein FtsQ/DivIB [Streptococcus dysgalactiae]WCE86868.1 cell division protein FtsQ/DivIB [Streptococcus dysgalactiae]WCN26865.1 cell division protein FtsQ/DivIB [Streptococcus dysgalactiae]BBE39771.1 cell division protein DivIB [Streptococcus dysgalactiae]